MKIVKAAFAALVVLTFLVTGAYAYDQVPQKFEEFNQEYVDLSTTHPEILCVGSGVGIYFDINTLKLVKASGTFAMGGSGTLLADGYVLTAAHVVTPEVVAIQETKNVTVIAKLIFVTDQIIHVGNGVGTISATIYWIDIEHDICLLKLVGNWPAAFPTRYNLASTVNLNGSDLLHEGDAIAVIVSTRDATGDKSAWYEVRYGKIIAPKPILPDYSQDQLPWFNLYDVTTDVQIYPGDSGSAVFAFDNGKPIIIGVARAAYNDFFGLYYAYFTRGDIVWALLEAEK